MKGMIQSERPIIQLENLTRSFGTFLAVDHLSLQVSPAVCSVAWGQMALEKLPRSGFVWVAGRYVQLANNDLDNGLIFLFNDIDNQVGLDEDICVRFKSYGIRVTKLNPTQ